MVKLKALAGKVNRRKTIPVNPDEAAAGQWTDFDGKPIDSQHLLISMMLPSAVKEFIRELQSEVDQICGARYERQNAAQGWGSQEGSITLANQKVRVDKPRVRNSATNEEIVLPTYQRFQNSELFNEKIFVDGIKNLTPRLKHFFSTTNPIESLNYLTEEDLRRVKNWRDSEHFQRWMATSVLANEKRMKKVMGFRALPAVKAALEKLCTHHHEEETLDKEVMLA